MFVLLVIYIGLNIPLLAIFWTPVITIFTTVIILMKTTLSLKFKFGYIILLIITYDLLVKYFSPGTHDREATGIIMLFSLLGNIVITSVTITYGITSVKSPRREYYLHLTAMLILLWTYTFPAAKLGEIAY